MLACAASSFPQISLSDSPSRAGLRLGALARNSDTANHRLVRERYPLLTQAILSGASPQLRNVATNGGNLLQRTRCPYFMDPAFPRCNKREPGTGCDAVDGFNRRHAILGWNSNGVATHPSDMAVALTALDAKIVTQGVSGTRTIAIDEFYRLPGNTPHMDTDLKPGELIVAIELPPSAFAAHSHYLKVRDRASYDFALLSAAVALDMTSGTIRNARLALGGVAHKPWRAAEAERALIGAGRDFVNSSGRDRIRRADDFSSTKRTQLYGFAGNSTEAYRRFRLFCRAP